MDSSQKNTYGSVDVNIIIPVKDEEDNISLLAREISDVMGRSEFSWECVWIDDGSSDNTLLELMRINKEDERHAFIALTQNFGQSAALHAGFRSARARIIATIDGDGQNDPNDIPAIIRVLLENDADMVNGVRLKRQDDIIRKLSSRIANSVRNWMTSETITDVGCSLRVFRRECVENIFVFKGMHRFLPTLVRINGYSRITETPVNHRPRTSGQTKYGINNRLWVGLIDLIAVCWMKLRTVSPRVKVSSVSKEK